MTTGNTSLVNAEATSLIGEGVDVLGRVGGTREGWSTGNLLTLDSPVSRISRAAESGSRDGRTQKLYLW